MTTETRAHEILRENSRAYYDHESHVHYQDALNAINEALSQIAPAQKGEFGTVTAIRMLSTTGIYTVEVQVKDDYTPSPNVGDKIYTTTAHLRLTTEPVKQHTTPPAPAGDAVRQLRELANECRHAFDGPDGHEVAGLNKNTVCRIVNAIDALAAPAAVAVPDAEQPTWRLLTHDDKIERGDEVLHDDTVTWGQLSGWEIGMEYMPGSMMPVRRQIATRPRDWEVGGND